MGCHNVQIGQKSVISGLPRYQDPDWKEQTSAHAGPGRRACQSRMADKIPGKSCDE